MGNYYKIGYKGRDYVVNLDKVNTDKMLEDAKCRFEEARAKNVEWEKQFSKLMEHQRKGMGQEKKKDLDGAIEEYEYAVDYGEKAPLLSLNNYLHSAERLMILYHKKKDYKAEIRIIQKTIELFHMENKKLAE